MSKKMRELEEFNFRTVWEGEFSYFWACLSSCAEQTPNIVEFRECMGECHKQVLEQAAKARESRREKDDAPEEQDKESAEAL